MPNHGGGFLLEPCREGEQYSEALADWMSIACPGPGVQVHAGAVITSKEKPKRLAQFRTVPSQQKSFLFTLDTPSFLYDYLVYSRWITFTKIVSKLLVNNLLNHLIIA